jgi:hypothetical protein
MIDVDVDKALAKVRQLVRDRKEAAAAFKAGKPDAYVTDPPRNGWIDVGEAALSDAELIALAKAGKIEAQLGGWGLIQARRVRVAKPYRQKFARC